MKAAAFQMAVTGDPDANFRLIAGAIENAAREGAKLLALPECAISGYPPLHYTEAREIDVALIERLGGEVRRLAAAHQVAVVVGTITSRSGNLLNSALVISESGELVGTYDKLHLMPDEKPIFAPGTGVRTYDILGTTIGALICYDARFPEPFRYLRDNGARLIVNISCACGGAVWKRPVLEGTYRARASENSCFLIAVNAAGPLQMATSRILNPLGLDLAAAQPDTEQMLFAELDLTQTESGYYYDRRADQFEVRGKWEC